MEAISISEANNLRVLGIPPQLCFVAVSELSDKIEIRIGLVWSTLVIHVCYDSKLKVYADHFFIHSVAKILQMVGILYNANSNHQ